MADTGVICTICNAYDHRANSCPDRIKRFQNHTGYAPKFLFKALFLETYADNGNPKSTVLYTLKNEDIQDPDIGLVPSLYKLYLLERDPTEYTFVTNHLATWAHWQELCQKPWFQDKIGKWRTELELLLRAEAFKRIREEAEADGRNAFAANKFLISQGWIDKAAEPSRRGRPSRDEIRKIAVEEAFSTKSIEDDLKRLELN